MMKSLLSLPPFRTSSIFLTRNIRRFASSTTTTTTSSSPSSSSTTPESTRSLLNNAVIHRVSSANDSHQFMLLPPSVSADQASRDHSLILASIHSHKNILFGAQTSATTNDLGLVESCQGILAAALDHVGQTGEQPQAIASLVGLSRFVQECIENDHEIVKQQLDEVTLEAVKAIATGVPRPGHSVVGVGTFRDGTNGWDILAKEFVNLNLCQEVNLYKSHNAQLVAIEHQADMRESYVKSAGGAMARCFFL